MCVSGGPIAALRQPRRLNTTTSTSSSHLIFCTGSARLLAEHVLVEHVVAMGWTSDAVLACVLETGHVRLYDSLLPSTTTTTTTTTTTANPVEYTQLTLGQVRIRDARFFSAGLVAMTSDFQFALVSNLTQPRTVILDAGLGQPPTAWLVIPPHMSLSRQIELVLSVGSALYTLDQSTGEITQVASQLNLDASPVIQMALSPNGKFLALINQQGTLYVVTADFQTAILTFETKTTTPPLALAWCGSDSILIHWPPDILLMLGPGGDWIKYSTPSSSSSSSVLFIQSEQDGARLLSQDAVEFIQRVPDACVDVFGLGSTQPSAMLFDAWECFERRDPKADEIIRALMSPTQAQAQLDKAIEGCIEAAMGELDTGLQKNLLRAAVFGKAFSDTSSTYDQPSTAIDASNHTMSDRIHQTSKTLRVLNAIRDFEIGIPLTTSQLASLGPQALLNRLLRQNQHLLALRIGEYLDLKGARQLVISHWAAEKMRRSLDSDDVLCQQIVSKLNMDRPSVALGIGNTTDTDKSTTTSFIESMARDISFAEVAKIAYRVGRPALSAQLLEFDRRPTDQIPLLLSMNQYDTALQKAIRSHDADLVYSVLVQVKMWIGLPDFFRMLSASGNERARQLWEVYLRRRRGDGGDTKTGLRDYMYQDDRRYDLALLDLVDAYALSSLDARLEKLKGVFKSLAELKDQTLAARAIEDQLKLLTHQEQLEKSLRRPFLGLTLTATLYDHPTRRIGSCTKVEKRVSCGR